jgi:hypothetical protein
MSSVTYYGSEDILYASWIFTCKDCLDCFLLWDSEHCYECLDSNHLYNCTYLKNSENCFSCSFSRDLKSCNHCAFCSNLANKEYYLFNTPYSKEDYFKEKEKLMSHPLQKIKSWYQKLNTTGIVRYAHFSNCENCTGDNLGNCHNALECFWTFDVEDSKFICSEKSKHCYDGVGGTVERSYEFSRAGRGINILFSVDVVESNFMLYSCYNCNHCFGCIGLRHKEYCILNKQYTKDEYEILVTKIIEKMKVD